MQPRKSFLLDIEVKDILDFEHQLFEYIDTKYPEIPEEIRRTQQISGEADAALQKAIEECKERFKS